MRVFSPATTLIELRCTSWLLATKCFAVAMTCRLWMPLISAAACCPVRYGSSLNVSGARPQLAIGGC